MTAHVGSTAALLADVVPAKAYGRAYGYERAMDNFGAILGPLLALALVAAAGLRWAIALSVLPGVLAAAAIVYAIRHTRQSVARDRVPIRIKVRPVLKGRLGRLLAAIAAFEVGNVAATLLILRATELLTPNHGLATATTIAILLYTGYNVASIPAGRLADRLGAGVACFALAYAAFALAGTSIVILAIPFLLAGVGIGAVETAEHAAVAAQAPTDIRGSAFGMLAAIQSAGNLAASTVAGLLWTLASPTVAFWYLVAWMLVAVIGLTISQRRNFWRKAGAPPDDFRGAPT